LTAAVIAIEDLHSPLYTGHQLWPNFCFGNRESAYMWIDWYAID